MMMGKLFHAEYLNFVAVNKIWMTALLESICFLTKEVIKGDVSDMLMGVMCA